MARAPGELIQYGAVEMRSQRCLRLVLFVLLVALMSASYAPTLASVTISSFEAQGQVGQIVVTWTTANESNNVGFNLWRDTSENFVRPTLLNDQQLIPSQCLGCIAGTDYVYIDTDVTAGQLYFYKLESVDVNGATETFNPVSAIASSPPVVLTRPPTHTPEPSPTPTPTDTRTPTATGTGGPPPTASATLSTSTPTPTSTPQTETPTPLESTATATLPLQAVAPDVSDTPAPPLPSSPAPTRAVEPGRTATAFVSTVVVRSVTPGPTSTRSTAAQAIPSAGAPAATIARPAQGGGPSVSIPTRPVQSLSPAAEKPEVEWGQVLIGTGLIGVGAVLGLSVMAVLGYFLWRRSSHP